MELKTILESLIFAAGRVLGTSEILEILSSGPEGMVPSRKDLESALEELQKEWADRGRGISLLRVAEGYEFRTTPEVSPWIQLLNQPKPHRLSTPAIETLSLIAYRQPTTRADIESIRGVDTGGVLRSLLERRLIRIVGRKEDAGRALLYATSQEFLELFGLQNLDDLPPLKELEEMIKSQSVVASPEDSFVLSDLMSTVEEESLLKQEDRVALDELDRSLQDLKDLEKEDGL